MVAARPPNEEKRLAALRQLSVLDTGPEPLFDAVARVAALVTDAPMALIALVDAQRQWCKANIGLPGLDETPRDVSFCAHTILTPNVLEVPDARADSRFASSPLVTGDPAVRFYAGAPVTLSGGARVGTVCVLDVVPRTLDDARRSMLQALAQVVAVALDSRARTGQQQAALEHRIRTLSSSPDLQRCQERLLASEAAAERMGRLGGVGTWELDLDTQHLTWSAETRRLHDVAPEYVPTLEAALGFYEPESRKRFQAALQKSITEGVGWDLEVELVTATRFKKWMRAVGSVDRAADGKPRMLVGTLQDITVRKCGVLALEASERRYRMLFERSLGPICTHDYEGVLLSANAAAAGVLGYSIGELLGRRLADLMPPDRREEFRQYLLRIMRNDRDSGMMQLCTRDGSLRTWQYQNFLDDDGDEPYVLMHAQDITERYEQEQALQELSTHDPLTGCFNRRFLRTVEDSLDSMDWGCISIDLDHFKEVNDTRGHQYGDEVLVRMAQFLVAHSRAQDAVVRMGGDEFLVMVRDTDAQTTQSIAAQLEQERVHAPIGFTTGTALCGHGVSLDAALAQADRRLYRRRKMTRGGPSNAA
jgi:diguanylate cyclase (GGDEF)-like protein/PAS domain S-box-containing protein